MWNTIRKCSLYDTNQLSFRILSSTSEHNIPPLYQIERIDQILSTAVVPATKNTKFCSLIGLIVLYGYRGN